MLSIRFRELDPIHLSLDHTAPAKERSSGPTDAELVPSLRGFPSGDAEVNGIHLHSVAGVPEHLATTETERRAEPTRRSGLNYRGEHSTCRKNRFYITLVLGVALLCLFASALAFAQTNMSRHAKSDTEKIADAVRAGPAFITKDATLLDWPAAPGGEYRILRKGSNEWMCLPGIPGYPHDEPGCFDTVFLRWIQDSLAGRTPHIDRIGISYMYGGAWAKSAKAGAEFQVVPHLMIVSPNQNESQGFNRDPSNGMPYVAHLPDRTELYLVMPIRHGKRRCLGKLSKEGKNRPQNATWQPFRMSLQP